MGNVILTTVGRDEIANYLGDKVDGQFYKFRLGEGGFVKSALITCIIEAAAMGGENTYDYIITGGDFVITGVNPGTKKFTIAGDKTEYFSVGAQIKVTESTGNDGLYTVVSFSVVGVDTEIEVSEAIPDPTVDGSLYIDRLPILKMGVDAWQHTLKVIEYNGVIVVQTLEDNDGEGNLTQAGGGTGTVNYKTGALHAEFTNNVTVGNAVKVEYKYANVPKQPVASKTELESQEVAAADDLFTFEKEFAVTDLIFRGVGLATMRCKCYLSDPEGIDDGDSYGGTPYYFEGGIFDKADVLIAYFTFDKERKKGSTTISHTVDFIL